MSRLVAPPLARLSCLALLLALANGCTEGPVSGVTTSDAGEPVDASASDAGFASDGAVTVHAALEETLTIRPSDTCRYGGVEILRGADDGVPGGTADDGLLDAEEISFRELRCRTSPDVGQIAASGIDVRPTNATCRPPVGPSETEGATLVDAFPGVVFPPNPACIAPFLDTDCGDAFRPTVVLQHPARRAFYVAEQTGRIVTFPEGAAPGTVAEVALDLGAKVVFGFEPGLLSATFDPAHPSDWFLSYVTCTSQRDAIAAPTFVCPDGEGFDVFHVVSRFRMRDDGTLDPGSERLVLEVAKPRTEHNGGGVAFGPDGKLFVAFGDGGEFPSSSAQDPASWLGKILRIDVHDAAGQPLASSAPAYRVPNDNPFVGVAGSRPEIFALGFRNPWRFGFEPTLDAGGRPVLWVGDVGLVTAEELDRVQAGENHGWPIMEGTFCRGTGEAAARVSVLADTSCNAARTYAEPAYAYVQAQGVSITAGPVYTGAAIPSLVGAALFSDFSRGQIQAAQPIVGGGRRVRFVTESNLMVATFGTDLAQEIYVTDWWTGAIRKLVPVDSSRSRPPSLLSATGCVDPANPRMPAIGAIPFTPAMPLFTEREVDKSRYLYLPDGARMTEYAESGSFIVPRGSVLVKNFDVGGRRIETRISFFHDDGGVTFWSYRWREDQTDAMLVEDAGTVDVDGVRWQFPSRGQCFHCHTRPTGRVLGLRVHQLNGLAYYPDTDRWANQIDTLRAIDVVDRVVALDPARPIDDANATIVPMPPASSLASVPRIEDEDRPLRARVGAYLESNCSHCHRPAGGARGTFDLRAEGFLDPDSTVCNALPQSEAYDDPTSRIVVPGAPERSLLLRRMEETELPYRMHPYRDGVDPDGIALVRRWITSDAAFDCTPR